MKNRFRLSHPLHLLALGFGLGLAPVAPGTFGTLAALPFLAALLWLPATVYAVMVSIITIAGIWICGRVAKDVGVHDHAAIVWDEIAGFLIAVVPVTIGVEVYNLLIDLVFLFVLFRLLDALKPWPISLLDRQLGGGLGIMADDVAAGAAAAGAFFVVAAIG